MKVHNATVTRTKTRNAASSGISTANRPTQMVVDARYLRPGATGVGHYIKGILTGLNHIAEQENIHVHAFTPPALPQDLRDWYESLENVSPIQIDVNPMDHPANEFFLQGPVDSWMKKLDSNLLFCPAFFGPLGRKKYRRVVCFHDTLCWDFPENYPWSFRTRVQTWGKLSASAADLLVCPSPGAREQIIGHGIGNPGIVPYGIDHRIFRTAEIPREKKSDTIEVVFLASFERRKNHQIIFEALESRPASELSFHLTLLHQATEEEKRIVEERTGHLNVDVVWPENQQLIATAFHEADFSVLPSLAEGFGAPALESMACGCPTILSATNWFKQLSGHGKRAWLADPYDSRDWAQRMVDCVTDKEETLQKSQAASRFASLFTWDSSARKLIGLCQERGFLDSAD